MSDPHGGLIERLHVALPGLPEAQRSLAELVLRDPAAVARMTIVELARRCEVSTGTVTRFCHVLGLDGYTPLRIALAAESGRSAWAANVGAEVTESDDIGQVARIIAANIGRVVNEAITNLDLADVDRVAGLLAAARRVEIFGVGGSAATASEFHQRLFRIGVPAWMHTDFHVALTGAALLGRGDVVVVVSHGGRTREVCDLIAEARSHAAATVAITNDGRSEVARRAQFVLATAVREVGSNTENILGRHAQLAVLDLLYIAITQRTFEQSKQAMLVTAEAVRPHKVDEATHVATEEQS